MTGGFCGCLGGCMGGLGLSGVWWGSSRGVEGVWRVCGGHLVCVWWESRRVLEGVWEMS